MANKDCYKSELDGASNETTCKTCELMAEEIALLKRLGGEKDANLARQDYIIVRQAAIIARLKKTLKECRLLES